MAVAERTILFLCRENAVRSPIAEALMKRAAGPDADIDSAGIDATQIHPFAIAVMREIGIDLMEHESRDISALRGKNFDLIIALAPEAREAARMLAGGTQAGVEYWDTPAPPAMGEGNREQTLEGYRRLRDDIARHIMNRFNLTP